MGDDPLLCWRAQRPAIMLIEQDHPTLEALLYCRPCSSGRTSNSRHALGGQQVGDLL